MHQINFSDYMIAEYRFMCLFQLEAMKFSFIKNIPANELQLQILIFLKHFLAVGHNWSSVTQHITSKYLAQEKYKMTSWSGN